ncbi:MAG: APC family permease [Actinomycetes bacterium]
MSNQPSSAPPGGVTTDLSDIPVREFSLRSAFALAFSNISPIVGIYSVFAIGLAAAGPAFIWAFPVVLIGQLIVAGVFGDLVSKWPFQGSVYAWSRELAGPRYGWFTNWAYMWGLTIALSALSLFASQQLLAALGHAVPSSRTVVLVGLGVIAFGSVANLLAGPVLKGLLYLSMTAELIASLGIGVALLFFHRQHSFHALFTGLGTAHGVHWLTSPFILVVAFVGFSFLGFESAGSIAEEVQESRKVLPKAIVLSLLAAGLLVMFACLGLVLAVPDLPKVLSGADTNPIATTLVAALGSGVGRVLLVALTIGFTASLIAVQTAVTRAIWATARDHALPGSPWLSRLGGKERVPRNAIMMTAVIAGALLFVSSSPRLYALLLSFANAGFYIAYTMPILALVWVRSRGHWSPGSVSMGRWSRPVTYVAAVWISLEAVNIAWPRTVPGQVWWLNWGLIIMSVVLGTLGMLISRWVFRPGTEVLRLSSVEAHRDREAS